MINWNPAKLAYKMETINLNLGASFPVIFSDGGLEYDIGTILLHPSLGFKRFMTLISQKLGIPIHQISTFLVHEKNATTSRLKVPIDESSDFAAIAKERNCLILAIVHRSRRTRMRRRSERGKAIAGEAGSLTPEKMILKRFPANGLSFDVSGAAGLRLWNYEGQLQNMNRDRERYLLFTGQAYTPQAAAQVEEEARETPPGFVDEGAFSSKTVTSAAKSVVCKECVAAETEGRSDDFHWCVYDVVTVGFRSTVGAIQRPSNYHV